jgi:hypothetical protein
MKPTKSFKIRDLMIQVQPHCGLACSLSCNGDGSLPCEAGGGPTVCHPTVCHPASVCVERCSLTASVCEACTVIHTCVGCSVVPCTAHPCSVFPCSAHPCSANACSVFACSVHPCSANPCSAHPCSANVCSVIHCSLQACTIVACSERVCSLRPTLVCPDITYVTCPGGSVIIPGPPGDLTALVELKAQLKKQLAAVEEHEKATEESLKPQTVAEVDDLHAKLQAAMEELKARRVELEKQEKSKGKEPK